MRKHIAIKLVGAFVGLTALLLAGGAPNWH
jgi:hypothetical protein